MDNRSGAPIYDQIYTQIRKQILSGALGENSLLPSIRNLAKDLRVSVITTKRAYDELEREGLIYTVAGKGCYVARPHREKLLEENRKAIEAHLTEAARLAAASGLSAGDLAELIKIIMEDET